MWEVQTFPVLQELEERGIYFYNQAIESVDTNTNHYHVKNHGNMIMLGGYSYLGLDKHPYVQNAARKAIQQYGTGTPGVRLLAGTMEIHKLLEQKLASFLSTEAAVTFSSGYMANVSTIASLVGQGDSILCDRLDHASIVDGCKLSGATVKRFRHNDMKHLEIHLKNSQNSRRRLVVVDGVYSMDGDVANLPSISELCKQYDALVMVDECHSIGVLGATGRGIEEHFDLPAGTVDIKVGSLGKSIPSSGGFVTCSHELARYLQHEARGFIFSGAISPSVAAAALAGLEIMENEPERVAKLHQKSEYFRYHLKRYDLNILASTTAIVPILCGDQAPAVELANYCQQHKIFLQAVFPPVVPAGSCRLRASINSNHNYDDLDYCIDVIRKGAREFGIIK